MHPDYTRADALNKRVIGAAVEVHRNMGPGLIESIYEKCFMRELELQGMPAKNQIIVPVAYKGVTFE